MCVRQLAHDRVVAHHEDAVGQADHLGHVARDEQDRLAVRSQVLIDVLARTEWRRMRPSCLRSSLTYPKRYFSRASRKLLICVITPRTLTSPPVALISPISVLARLERPAPTRP